MQTINFFLLTIILNASYIRSDAQTWGSVGTGTNNYVTAIEVYNSNLYAGGGFTTAGGNTANSIAKFDGINWDSLGSGMPGGDVSALSLFNGKLCAAGTFYDAGGLTVNGIANWDGANWSALGTGIMHCSPFSPGYVNALSVYNSDLYAGGNFCNAGGITANNIAKWDGSGWTVLTAPALNGPALALEVYSAELYVGGGFNNAGGVLVSNIVKWNGTSWSTAGTGLNASPSALTVYNNELYAGGVFTSAGGSPANYIAKWNGTNWLALGSGTNGRVYSLAVYNGELYVGGRFTMAGGSPANHIAKWDGTNWSALGAGTDTTVYAMAAYNNDLYVGGTFTIAGGSPANYIAKWNSPIGLKKLNISDDISVYPNPVIDKLVVEINNGVKKINELTLVDVYGVQHTAIMNNKNEIDVSELNAGVYFLQVKTSEGVGVKKIIVQH